MGIDVAVICSVGNNKRRWWGCWGYQVYIFQEVVQRLDVGWGLRSKEMSVLDKLWEGPAMEMRWCWSQDIYRWTNWTTNGQPQYSGETHCSLLGCINGHRFTTSLKCRSTSCHPHTITPDPFSGWFVCQVSYTSFLILPLTIPIANLKMHASLSSNSGMHLV